MEVNLRKWPTTSCTSSGSLNNRTGKLKNNNTDNSKINNIIIIIRYNNNREP